MIHCVDWEGGGPKGGRGFDEDKVHHTYNTLRKEVQNIISRGVYNIITLSCNLSNEMNLWRVGAEKLFNVYVKDITRLSMYMHF